MRSVSWAIAILVCTSASASATSKLSAVYRIEARTDAKSEGLVQTGFSLEGSTGIITALHGVIGAADGLIAAGNTTASVTGLRVVAVDIARDIALLDKSAFLTHPRMASNKSTTGLAVSSYPLGMRQRLKTLNVALREASPVVLSDLFPANMDRVARQSFVSRRSPEHLGRVLAIQDQLQPGESGAPLYDEDSLLVAVCIGGLSGTTIGFAIPWWTVDLVPRETVEAEWRRVRREPLQDLLRALAMSEVRSYEQNLAILVGRDFGNFDDTQFSVALRKRVRLLSHPAMAIQAKGFGSYEAQGDRIASPDVDSHSSVLTVGLGPVLAIPLGRRPYVALELTGRVVQQRDTYSYPFEPSRDAAQSVTRFQSAAAISIGFGVRTFILELSGELKTAEPPSARLSAGVGIGE